MKQHIYIDINENELHFKICNFILFIFYDIEGETYI